MLAVTNRATLNDKSKVSNMVRRDYARQLFLALVEDGKGTKGAPKARAVSSAHATWPSLIKAAIEDASTSKTGRAVDRRHCNGVALNGHRVGSGVVRR